MVVGCMCREGRMKNLKAIILCAVWWIGLCAVSSAQSDLFYGGFNGRWEGKLRPVAPESFDKEHGIGGGEFELAISYRNGVARAYWRGTHDAVLGRGGLWALSPVSWRQCNA